MKKVLVTGSTGMLGSAIIDFLLKKNFEIFGISRSGSNLIPVENQIIGDLCNEDLIRSVKEKVEPDYIIHTAAFVNLNFCQENKIAAYDLHVKASGFLASLFPTIPFIYISTDSVFDGLNGNYKETDQPNPLNYYAETKYLGELEVLAKSLKPLILRTNIYGVKHNTGNSLAEWAIKQLGNENKISGFSNVLFNPLYIYQLAEIIFEVIENKSGLTGILNVGCKEYISKYTFLKMLADTFNFDPQLILEAELQHEEGKLQRPLNTTLNTDKYFSVFKKHVSILDGLSDLKIFNQQLTAG